MHLTNVIIETHLVLLFTLHNTKNIAYRITEVLIYYADKLMVMGNSKNLCVFNFAILLKSRKFDAREIYIFYSTALSPQKLKSTVMVCVCVFTCKGYVIW